MSPDTLIDAAAGTNFKAAMRKFPATVTVVTAREGDHDHGMTVTAVTSVSMDPPSLLVCLNNSTRVHEMLLTQPYFAVNVLGHDHFAVSDAFSGKIEPDKRFALHKWNRDRTGVLLLDGAHANVVCRRVAAVPYGTHTMFIGQVLSARVDEVTKPLLYENAQYCISQPAA